MRALIAWFANNRVAANLLMAMLLIGGALSVSFTLRYESFPTTKAENIMVSVLYPGATPEEVEESICMKIEEAVEGVDDVDRVVSSASENLGSVTIEIVDGADINKVFDDVKNEVDSIDSFPVDAEEPLLRQQTVDERVIAISVSGHTSEQNLRVIADELREELQALPGISKVELEGAREWEISIEVDETALRRYRLSFSDVSRAVRQNSLNLPAGSVKTRGEEILFRSSSQAYSRRDFEQIPVYTLADGSRVLLGDIARVTIGFEDNDLSARFDGAPSIVLQVYRRGHENTPEVSAITRAFIEEARGRLPESISLDVWRDEAVMLQGRFDLLERNGIMGLMLVFLVLALFLKIRLAAWVAIGLTAAVAGTLWAMPWLGISMNFLSSFGLILVLGILVDDAIVIAENIDAHAAMGKRGNRAAIEGTWEVMVPVVLAVVTTAIAFSPMLNMPGRIGTFTFTIALTVILAISFSLVESLLILPAHLGHDDRPAGGLFGWIQRAGSWLLAPLALVLRPVQRLSMGLLDGVIERLYKPTLDFAMRWRYLTVASGLATLIFTAGLLGGGWMKLSFFPPIEGNDVICTLRLAEGASVERTWAAVRVVEEAAEALRGRLDGDAPGSVVRHIRTTIGDQPGSRSTGPPATRSGRVQSRGNLGEVHIEMVSPEDRDIYSKEVARLWRAAVGDVIGVEELLFQSDRMNTGTPINVELSGPRIDELEVAAAELKEWLATVAGTLNITDDYRPGKLELELEILPSGAALGLTQSDLTRQVRQGFYGDEAQRVQLGPNDVKVFIRYPSEARRSLADLEGMRIRLSDNTEVPFSVVARVNTTRGPATIQRIDSRRSIVVTSDIDRSNPDVNANDINAELLVTALPALIERHPGITHAFGGEQKRQSESMASLFSGIGMALFLMFALLGVVFRSYMQPIIVLSAIPFGVAGAIWGHFFLGMHLTFLSMIGMLALMGVVVNDSLVLIDFVNRFRREHGKGLEESIREAGPRRFRPILLTSLTTCAGLTPIILETSVQAKFVIPMAVSLAFGVAASTAVILVFVPASYLIVEDLGRLLTGRGEELPSPDPTELELGATQ